MDLIPKGFLLRGTLRCVMRYVACWKDAHLSLATAGPLILRCLFIILLLPQTHTHTQQPFVECHIFFPFEGSSRKESSRRKSAASEKRGIAPSLLWCLAGCVVPLCICHVAVHWRFKQQPHTEFLNITHELALAAKRWDDRRASTRASVSFRNPLPT